MTNTVIKNKINIEEIPFYNDVLLGGKDKQGNIWLAIPSTCKSLGFTEKDKDNQIAKINNDEVLKMNTLKIQGVQKEGERLVSREMWFISEKAIPLWLAKINVTSKMKIKYPELSEKLIKYQLECASVLHNYFMGTEEKKEQFFDDMLGLELKEIKAQNKLLAEQNESILADNQILQLELQALHNEFDSFKSFRSQQSEQLELIIKRFDIYDNPDIKYTRLINDFCAVNKVYSDRLKHKTFWIAICNWVGIDYDLLLQQSNKKKWLLDNVGLEVMEYFVDNVILYRIIQNDNGNWINLNGYNGDIFGIEQNKILDYWTDKSGRLRCAYCGNIIENPQLNINYNFEHLINKTTFGSTNTIENIVIACCTCNEEKGGSTYIEYIKNNPTKGSLISRIDSWINTYKLRKELI